MSSSCSDALSLALKGAIALTGDVKTHPDANQAFEELIAQLPAEHETEIQLLQQLWTAYISTRRSARFWEEMSDVEKAMSDRMAQANIQLQQNYLRLVQEQ